MKTTKTVAVPKNQQPYDPA